MNNTQLLQGGGVEEVRLVKDDDEGAAALLAGLEDLLLELGEEDALGEPGREAEAVVEVLQDVVPAEGGQRGVEGAEEVVVEAVDEAAQGDGLANAGVAGEEHDAAVALHVVEACAPLGEGVGGEHVGSLDVLGEGHALQAEPGEQVLHRRTSPRAKETASLPGLGSKVRAFSRASTRRRRPTRERSRTVRKKRSALPRDGES